MITENNLLEQVNKVLVIQALKAEIAEHLCDDEHARETNSVCNSRNGESPNDREGRRYFSITVFETQIYLTKMYGVKHQPCSSHRLHLTWLKTIRNGSQVY